tara:strand:+ start:647 stop:850 length:204 start_codon:yes stop_codon:yes gene_type:complete
MVKKEMLATSAKLKIIECFLGEIQMGLCDDDILNATRQCKDITELLNKLDNDMTATFHMLGEGPGIE